jgi:acyl-coenzyme A synthetase/AMP-(fatty) acid ligase
LRGERQPGRAEAAIGSHPAVSEVAVVGIPDEAYGESTVACAVVDGLASQDLDGHTQASELAYTSPRAYLFLHELPHYQLGKPSRKDLRATASDARRLNNLRLPEHGTSVTAVCFSSNAAGVLGR